MILWLPGGPFDSGRGTLFFRERFVLDGFFSRLLGYLIENILRKSLNVTPMFFYIPTAKEKKSNESYAYGLLERENLAGVMSRFQQ